MSLESTQSNLEKEKLDFLLKVLNIHEQLLDKLDYSKIETLDEDKEKLTLYLKEEIIKHVSTTDKIDKDKVDPNFIQAVIDEVIGFGPAETLIRDPSITDIFINGPSSTFVERAGRVEPVSIFFLNSEHIFRLVQRVASKSGRHLDLSMPYFDAQIPGGSRIHAIISPIAIDGIKVSIRKYQFQKLSIDSLVVKGSLTQNMAEFLKIAVQARLNIAICGGTGSGKTTLMNSLLASVSPGERMITIEDTPELEVSHPHTVRLLTRLANPEGKGAVTQADLMINALRMRPDRVILGELRGSEAFNLLHAMNTGQDGTMATLHASGTEEVVSRLLNMILMARYALSAESVRQQIAGALDLIIYVTRLFDGSRRVMAISQVSEENNDIKIEDLFNYEIEKITPNELIGNFLQYDVKPTKRITSKLTVSGLKKAYEALFDPKATVKKKENKA